MKKKIAENTCIKIQSRNFTQEEMAFLTRLKYLEGEKKYACSFYLDNLNKEIEKIKKMLHIEE